MRKGDAVAALKDAVAFAGRNQARAGFWQGPSWPRVYDTSLAHVLLEQAGQRKARLHAAHFLRLCPPSVEHLMPKPACALGLDWEWLLHATARSLALDGRDKQEGLIEVFLHRLTQDTRSIPPTVAALFGSLVQHHLLQWDTAPSALHQRMEEVTTAGSLRLTPASVDGLYLTAAALSYAEYTADAVSVDRLRSILVHAQDNTGSWLKDTGLTATLGILLAKERPAASQRAVAWLLSHQRPKGGFGPDSNVRQDTLAMIEALRPFSICSTQISRAESFLVSASNSTASTPAGERFNSWYDLGEEVLHCARQSTWVLHDAAVDWHRVEREQNTDGGWGFCRGMESNASSTASATLALALSGQAKPAIRGGRWLARHQRVSGSWRFLPEFLGPRPVRYNRPLEAHARAVLALSALKRLEQARHVRAS